MPDSSPTLYERYRRRSRDRPASSISSTCCVFDKNRALAHSSPTLRLDHLKVMQRELSSQALGGPFAHPGRPIREVHHGRGITPQHFQRFIEHLLQTLESFDLTKAEVNQIISRLNVDADKIVGRSNTGG